MEIIVHEIAKDGLPDMDNLTGRVAFIFDGCIVSGWPLDDGESWEADSDVGRHGTFTGVTHWVEFPAPVWDLPSTQPEARGVEGMVREAIKICSSFNTAQDMADYLNDELRSLAAPSVSPAVEGGLPPERVEDDKDWAFIERCKNECGASYDDGDDGIFWTFDLAAMKKLRRLATPEQPGSAVQGDCLHQCNTDPEGCICKKAVTEITTGGAA